MAGEKVFGDSALSENASETDDSCKVICTNHHHLRTACGIVTDKVGELVDRSKLSTEHKEKLKRTIDEVYRKTIQENVTVKGITWEMWENRSALTIKKEERKAHINETLLPNLGKMLVETTSKRKYYPQECCRVLKQRLKLERQHMKHQQMKIPSLPSCGISMHQNWPSTEKKFEEFSSQLNLFNKKVQVQIDKVKNARESAILAEKISSNQNKLLCDVSVTEKCLNDNGKSSNDLDMFQPKKNKCDSLVPSSGKIS